MSLRFDAVWGGGTALDCSWGVGAHCLLGAWTEGIERLFSLASGKVAPEHGKVTLDGVEPFRNPSTRARVVLVDSEAWLPNASTLTAAMSMLQAIHAPALQGESPRSCLERLGLSHLAERPTAELDAEERRAALLSLALGFRAPRLLLLAEPLSIRGVDRQALREGLADAARTGIVLVSTEHHAVVAELGSPTSVFAAGRLLVGEGSSDLRSSAFGCFRITSDDPKRLATLLLDAPEVFSVQAPLHTGTLEVSGVSPEALSLAVLRTALAAGIRLDHLIEVPAQLDVLQAAVRGRADGTYAAAYQGAWQAQMAMTQAATHTFAPAPPAHGHSYAGRIDDGGRAWTEPAAVDAEPAPAEPEKQP
jgi:ABC-2 type transport system ATP-binding protein